MDTSNWRPTEGGSGDVSKESSDWRAQLQADSRKKMVNRIMDALKSHVQVSGYEGRQEVEKMAVSFEENVYVAATSQSEYTRKICFKILTIETRSQNPNSVNPSYPAITSQNPNIVNPSYPAIVDWRVQLQADSRQRIVNKIMDTLKRHLPFSGPEGLQELKKIAVRFEDKVYSSATSQSDYLRTLSLKMLTMETRSQNPIPDPGSQIVRPVNSQGQPHPNHPHPTQQPLSQAMHTNIGSTEKQVIGDSSTESADWRSQLHADTRQKIVNKLMDSLKMRIPFGGHEGLHELEKIAVRFEEKIYTTATSQPDYFRKISLKMLTMETRSQNPIPDLM